MSNNDKWVKMETMKTNSSNKSNAKDPGIYTCPTCNALFTCLKFYQQHVTQHAESNGIKLFCCNKCRYSTEQIFQYNWHQMSHKGAPAHSCSVCEDRSDSYNSNNHLNGDDTLVTGKSARKSQQNGNSNKKIKYSNNKAFVKQEQQEEDEDDEEDEEDEESDADSDAEESDENESEEEDDEDESGESEEDEEEEVDEEDQNQLQNANFQQQNVQNNQIINQQEEEISDDEDDDEEEEIESEEDNGENNELPEEYLVAQRLNNNESGANYFDMQNQNSHNLNNNSTVGNLIEQGPPYTKSSNVTDDIPADLLLNDTGIICNKGRGKGNRKSRTINQMGGQVDDEMSQSRRKFHCSHCGKSFKTKSHLQRHILTHTGEKPYHCNRCGAKFNQSSSLRNHIIALHTKEYPHFCNHCNKGFLMPALLQKHLQTSHRDQQDS